MFTFPGISFSLISFFFLSQTNEKQVIELRYLLSELSLVKADWCLVEPLLETNKNLQEESPPAVLGYQLRLLLGLQTAPQT